MNNRLWKLVFFWLCPTFVWGQELIWEKRISLSTYESFSDVVKLSDGGYLALGFSRKWRILNPVESGAILMKFNANGDTLWTRWTGYYGGFGGIEKVSEDLFYALLGYWDASSNSNKIAILLLNGEGDMLGTIPIQVGSGESLMDMKIKDGYIWISGEKSPSLFYPGGLTFDFLLKKLRLDGTEVFSFVFNGDNQTSRGSGIEFMPNGNILFSGSCGRNISAFEIDTAGNQIGFRNYFQNPVNGGWQNASVSQTVNNLFFINGARSTSPVSHYLAIHDTSGARIWGGIGQGGSTTPVLFNDGSLVNINNSISPEYSRIRKFSLDSSLIWSLDLMGPGLIEGRKVVNDIAFESDSSGVCVGTMVPSGGGGQNLYICKFSGLGIPFDPTSTKAMETPKAEAPPIPFPNPGTDRLRFTQLSDPGKLSFMDMQGRKVWEGTYVPEQGINTERFRPGLYGYRLECNGKVWMGKWVKEAP